MKILVCGDRNWKDDIKMHQVFRTLPSDVTLIHGDCRGADKMSDRLAKRMGFKVIPYPAKWNIYGKGAGPIRNQQMLDENPDIDLVLAFHNGIDDSKGTRDMIQRANKKGVKYKLITSKTELI